MTGGVAVILGNVGKNFAAGMSGGTAYVYDTECDLYTKLNKQLVGFARLKDQADIDKELTNFKKVEPYDYTKMTLAIAKHLAEGKTREDAEIEAFRENAAKR